MLHNFEPFCQDCVAIELIKEHGALDAVQGGLIEQAIFLCSKVWASFPGNDYGQSGGHTMEVLEAKFKTINPPLSQI
jgi:muramidase (phage lysozyme)